MATSSYMSTSNGYVKFYVQVITNSQSVANNSSDVTVNVYAVRTNTGYTTSGSGSVTLTVNGQAFNSSGNYTITSSAVRIGGVTNLTVPHNADGTKTLIVSCAVNIPTIFSSSAQSYSEVLTTIARALKPTINVDGVSSTNIAEADMGTTLKIYTHRASNSFTHTITAIVGTTTITIATKTTSADTVYTFPTSVFASLIPNSSSATCTIYSETFNGTTSIGKNSCSFKLKVPTSLQPSIGSVSLTPINGIVPSGWGILVQNKSKITVTINNPVASSGATIKSYSISGAGYSGTTNPYTTGFLDVYGEKDITATITDSRNRSVTKTVKTSNIYQYYLPYPSSMLVYRCNASGVRDDEGKYLGIVATSNYAPCNGKNGGNVRYDYRITNGDWLKEPVTLTNGVLAIVGAGTISNDNSYEVKIIASDYFTANPVSFTIPTAYATMDFKKGGKGIAIGKVSTTDNLFEVDMESKFNKRGVVSEGYLTGIDLNDYTSKSGIYGVYNFLNGVNSSATSRETNIATLEVNVYSPDWVVQRLTYIKPTYIQVYTRTRHSGTTWSAWTHMYTQYYGDSLVVSRFTVFSGGVVSQSTGNATDSSLMYLRRSTGVTAGSFTLGEGGSNIRLHLYDTTGAWKTYHEFATSGMFLNGTTSLKRVSGWDSNNFYLGANVGRLECDTNVRLYNSVIGGSDCGMLIDNTGNVQLKASGVNKHVFKADGSKTGGTMEIEGATYGMSPTDSPQTLIEYIDFDVMVDGETEVFLDEIYAKMISKFTSVLSNSDIKLKEKKINSIILVGNGTTDIVFKGQRKGADEYFRIMNGFNNQGYTEDII